MVDAVYDSELIRVIVQLERIRSQIGSISRFTKHVDNFLHRYVSFLKPDARGQFRGIKIPMFCQYGFSLIANLLICFIYLQP